MSVPVDVLAALDMCIECFGAAEECPDDTACIEEIREARAAVAELIEAVNAHERSVTLAQERETRERMFAALARCTGSTP